MPNPNPNRQKGQQSALKAGTISAFILGALISFFLTPLIFNLTAQIIVNYADQSYFEGLGGPIKVLYGIALAMLVTTLSILSLNSGVRALIIKFMAR